MILSGWHVKNLSENSRKTAAEIEVGALQTESVCCVFIRLFLHVFRMSTPNSEHQQPHGIHSKLGSMPNPTLIPGPNQNLTIT